MKQITQLEVESPTLMYLKCLDPVICKKGIPVAKIGKLRKILSHVITEREVTLVQSQFKLLQVE